MLLKNQILQSLHQRPFLADIFWEETTYPKPVVILSHGFKGFKDWGPYDILGQYFATAGFVFVKYNFSHNGTTLDNPTEFTDLEAFGHNNFSKELDDLGVVIDWVCGDKFPLSNTEIDTSHLYLIGHSRGGGITILKAGEDTRVKKIASWAGVNEYGKYWKQDQMAKIQNDGVIYIENGRTGQQMPVYWQLYADYEEHIQRLFIPDVVKRLAIPMLIAHGTADEAIPYSAATEMKAWKPDADLLTLEGVNHVFGATEPWTHSYLPYDMKYLADETIKFFNKP